MRIISSDCSPGSLAPVRACLLFGKIQARIPLVWAIESWGYNGGPADSLIVA